MFNDNELNNIDGNYDDTSSRQSTRIRKLDRQMLLLLLFVSKTTKVIPFNEKMQDISATIKLVDSIQLDCFGDWNDLQNFPKSMPENEAGLTKIRNQRRYLWTDAFGILNFISQANSLSNDIKLSKNEIESKRIIYLNAAHKLIDTVYLCLGQPRSKTYPMIADPEQPDKYQGLRIGKLHARIGNSDMGMLYDGMYWHYIDKFIFAVSRYIHETKDIKELNRLVHLIKQVHPAFYIPKKGYLWKINIDLTPIPSNIETQPNHDALAALVVYKLVNELCKSTELQDILSIEIQELSYIAEKYYELNTPEETMILCMDPLSLGLHLWSNQWYIGSKSQEHCKYLFPMIKQILESSLNYTQVNFRLYGGLLGIQLLDTHSSKNRKLIEFSNNILEHSISHEMDHMVGDVEHSIINKVMLASAINPAAFQKYFDDPTINI